MLTFNGYIPKRRGVMDHLRDGRLSIMDYIVFDILLIWADANTGIATTNGPGLVFISGNQLKLDTVQTSLRNLEAGKYIARPFYVQGQRGDQKIFIDKFVCTKGKLKGKLLSFAKTTDWQNPIYVDLTEDPTDSPTESQPADQGVDQPSNEKLKTENENRKHLNPLGKRRGQVEKDQNPKHDASLDRLSAKGNTNGKGGLSGSEFARAVGAVEIPTPVHPAPPAQQENVPARRTAGDKYILRDEWGKLMRDVEVPDSAVDLLTPNFNDLAGLLEDTTDSIPRIIEVARWALEKSNYWFRNPKGLIRNSTDFRNAYPTMSGSYANYKAKEGA